MSHLNKDTQEFNQLITQITTNLTKIQETLDLLLVELKRTNTTNKFPTPPWPLFSQLNSPKPYTFPPPAPADFSKPIKISWSGPETNFKSEEFYIVPGLNTAYSLTTMLEGITPDKLHGEISTGPAVGKEAEFDF